MPTVALPADTANLITGCNTTGYCINVNATASGFATVELSLDGVPGIQIPGADRVITALI